mmetsp:Transcript_100330/g.173123  ORF Transcript_100330/g.173123 Transcript_100330/m.173123 type:complete len:87 (+) Transcript_100330:2-262(+)
MSPNKIPVFRRMLDFSFPVSLYPSPSLSPEERALCETAYAAMAHVAIWPLSLEGMQWVSCIQELDHRTSLHMHINVHARMSAWVEN